MGNPSPSLLVPAARLTDPRPLGEERKHLRFTVRSGPARASAVAFGTTALPPGSDIAMDATFGLELNEWQGAVEPRLVLRRACPPDPGPITVVGEPDDWAQAVRAELDALVAPYGGGAAGPGAGAGPRAGGSSGAAPDAGSRRTVRDRRGGGVAGTIAALVATGEPVLVVCSDARRRAGHLRGRLGGVALCSWWALERDPGLTARAVHVVALDPPPHPALRELLEAGPPGTMAHLAWGAEELEFAEHVHVEQHGLRDGLAAAYRAFRSAPADPAGALPRAPVAAGRILRVLSELDLVTVDPASLSVAVAPSPQRKRLESSPTFAACEARLEEGRRWLSSGRLRAA
jgi:single-stranded-DNA-specific exonuclease